MKTTMFVGVAFACGFGVSYLIFGRIVERDHPIEHTPAISKQKDESPPKKPSMVAAKSFPNLPRGHQAVVLPGVIVESVPRGPVPGDPVCIMVPQNPPDADKAPWKILVSGATLLEIEHNVVVDDAGRAMWKTVATVAIPTEELPYVELAMQRGQIGFGPSALRDESLQPAPAKNADERPPVLKQNPPEGPVIINSPLPPREGKKADVQKTIGLWVPDPSERGKDMGTYPPNPFFYDGNAVTYRFFDMHQGNSYYRLNTKWKENDLLVQAPFEGFRYATAGEWIRLATFEDGKFVSQRDGKKWSLSKKSKDEALDEEFFKEWPYYPKRNPPEGPVIFNSPDKAIIDNNTWPALR